MPQPKIFQAELIKPKEQIVAEIIQPKIKVEDKIEIIQSQKDPSYQVSKEQLIGLNNLIEEFKRKYEAQ